MSNKKRRKKIVYIQKYRKAAPVKSQYNQTEKKIISLKFYLTIDDDLFVFLRVLIHYSIIKNSSKKKKKLSINLDTQFNFKYYIRGWMGSSSHRSLSPYQYLFICRIIDKICITYSSLKFIIHYYIGICVCVSCLFHTLISMMNGEAHTTADLQNSHLQKNLSLTSTCSLSSVHPCGQPLLHRGDPQSPPPLPRMNLNCMSIFCLFVCLFVHNIK